MKKIRNELVSKFGHYDSLLNFTRDLIYLLGQKTNQRLVLALDEANCYTSVVILAHGLLTAEGKRLFQ